VAELSVDWMLLRIAQKRLNLTAAVDDLSARAVVTRDEAVISSPDHDST